eukprot:1160861-Pelagomonas_calceolata.AAC.7
MKGGGCSAALTAVYAAELAVRTPVRGHSRTTVTSSAHTVCSAEYSGWMACAWEVNPMVHKGHSWASHWATHRTNTCSALSFPCTSPPYMPPSSLGVSRGWMRLVPVTRP